MEAWIILEERLHPWMNDASQVKSLRVVFAEQAAEIEIMRCIEAEKQRLAIAYRAAPWVWQPTQTEEWYINMHIEDARYYFEKVPCDYI